MKEELSVLEVLKKYSKDIVEESIISCKYEKLACKRFLKDLDRDESFEYVFDETRAQRIFDFFKLCIHVQGCFSNKAIELQTWQKFDLGNIFGWVHKVSGKRRFRTAYIRIARGNTKSTMMSCIALYGLCADSYYPPEEEEKAIFEQQPQVVCGAVDRQQADIVWSAARQMGLNSPAISSILDIKKGSISHKKRGGSLKKLSKETKNKDGFAPCIIIIDEYHAHPTSLVKDVTSSGKGKRPQCLEMIITTAGEDAENKPCKIEDDICKKILEGDINNDDYYAVIRELDDDDDIHNSKMWGKSNPMFREKDEYSIELFNEVKSEHDLAYNSNDSSKIRQWLIKRANLFQVSSEEKYFSNHMKKWKDVAVSKEEFLERTKGKEVFCGIDLSKHVDLTGVGWVFKLEDGIYAAHAQGFIPINSVQRHEHTDRVPYRTWINDGWVTATEGDVTDDSFIEDYIEEMRILYSWDLKEICYDPYSARQFSVNMTKKEYMCIETRQGPTTLSEPTKKFRELVLQDKMIHMGSPLLTWCISNAYEISDSNGNIKLNKKHSHDSQRIDPLAAIMNAMHRAIVQEDKVNVYETRGMLSLLD